MAIEKSKTLSNGASGNYWKITYETYDKVTKKCTWIISLFTDKSFSDAGNPSLGLSKTYTYIASKEELQGNRTALGYTQIKAQAAAMVHPLFGLSTDPLVQFDPDLADGTDV